MTEVRTSVLAVAWLLLLVLASGVSAQTAAPPNSPARVEIRDSSITIRYDGKVIFAGTISCDMTVLDHSTQSYYEGKAVQQIVLLTTHDWNKKIRIAGTVTGSGK